jgi:hypothetical protein
MRSPCSLCPLPKVAMQRLGKHIPAATNTHATITEMLDAVRSMRSVLYQLLSMQKGKVVPVWMYRSMFFLTSAIVGGERLDSCSSRFTPRKRARSTHWIGVWVGPRVGLDDLEKILDPTGTRNSDPSVVQPVASRYTD